MNTKLTNRSIFVLGLGGWVSVACALSLGPVTGSTVVGRPLELVAPVQLDDLVPGDGSGCMTAEVRYGDRRVDDAQVRVEADAARHVSYATITSPSLVDEPFVTVLLHAGCARQSTRRYVLLADAPAERPLALAPASTLALAGPAPAAPPANAQAVAVAGRAVRPLARVKLASATKTSPPAPVRRLAAVSREAAHGTGGRLQLAVWDPNTEQVPWLRASMELKTMPTADGARRAAATSLWQALNAQPQDLLRTAERLRGLEGEMRSLRSLSSRHRADIASAREALQAAQDQRHTSLALVTLLALLTGGTAAFLWHRSRRSATARPVGSWYGPLDPLAEPVAVIDDEPEAPAAAAAAPVAGPLAKEQPAETAAAARPNEDPVRAEAVSPVLEPLPFTLSAFAPVAAPAQPPDGAGLKIDALNGAQQQSEFFASLGQIDEAVAVLTSYLEESSERPVLAYLELFRIYHGTGMRAEYEDLASTFRQTFGMDMASFSQYKDDNRELELFLVPVTRIAAAWPSARSLEVIEELVFKRPAAPRDLLSLQAYRELLWLYALGQEVVYHTGMPAGLQLLGDRSLPNDHFILPWAEGEAEGSGELSLDRLDRIEVAPGLDAFAVDIDLTTLPSESHPAVHEVHVAQPESKPVPRPEPAPEVQAKPAEAAPEVIDFDAVMEAQSRRTFR